MPINKDKKMSKSIIVSKEVEQEIYNLAYENRRSFSLQTALLLEYALNKLKEENKK